MQSLHGVLGKATLEKDTEAGAWLCTFVLRAFLLLLNLGTFAARRTEPCPPLCSAGKPCAGSSRLAEVEQIVSSFLLAVWLGRSAHAVGGKEDVVRSGGASKGACQLNLLLL